MNAEPDPINIDALPDIVAARQPQEGIETIVLDGERLLVWRITHASPSGVRVIHLSVTGTVLLISTAYDTLEILGIDDE